MTSDAGLCAICKLLAILIYSHWIIWYCIKLCDVLFIYDTPYAFLHIRTVTILYCIFKDYDAISILVIMSVRINDIRLSCFLAFYNVLLSYFCSNYNKKSFLWLRFTLLKCIYFEWLQDGSFLCFSLITWLDSRRAVFNMSLSFISIVHWRNLSR